ncbi:MAG TPA: hypothetical protein GX503_00235 [Clostridiales bacterium]|nr:hypothetical protein [Clostridiales bacterium]
MKYIAAICILPFFLYTFSFARYNWSHQNKLAAIGTGVLLVLSIALGALFIFQNL